MIDRHTPIGQKLTDLILETFRLNGALLACGDELVRDLDLTSARWQVLGAVALEGRPLTVAQIARRMGLSRQAVQRVANDLTAEGLATFLDNPDHKRAKLLALTEQGRSAYAEADARQIAWVNALGEGLDPSAVGQAVAIMRIIRDRCQSQTGGDENP